jgi:hypothetical protein
MRLRSPAAWQAEPSAETAMQPATFPVRRSGPRLLDEGFGQRREGAVVSRRGENQRAGGLDRLPEPNDGRRRLADGAVAERQGIGAGVENAGGSSGLLGRAEAKLKDLHRAGGTPERSQQAADLQLLL